MYREKKRGGTERKKWRDGMINSERERKIGRKRVVYIYF